MKLSSKNSWRHTVRKAANGLGKTSLALPYEWLLTRRPWTLFLGLPAIVLTGWVVYCQASGSSRTSQGQLLKRYTAVAQQADANKEPAKAELFYRKAVMLSDDNASLRFAHAASLYKLGQHDRAIGIMQILAPTDRPGFSQAHTFLAQHLQQQARPDLSAMSFHLRQSLAANPASADIRIALARVLARQNQYAEAGALLKTVLADHPEAHILMAQICVRTGHNDQANAEFDKAEHHYRNQLTLKPDDVQSRILLAQALVFRGRFKKAERVLIAGLSADQTNTTRDALVSTYLGWYDLTDKKDIATRVRCLDAALKLKSDHAATIQRCAALQVTTTDNSSSTIAEELNKALANGTAPTVVHIMLGTAAASKSDFSTAIVHLEQAQLESPDQPIVNNNLAWVLHQQSKSSPSTSSTDQRPNPEGIALLEQALIHATTAVEAAPRLPHFLETRGQILADLNNWREAIRDLEAALQLGMKSKAIHRSLATAYQSLGVADQARIHRKNSL